MDSPVQPVHAQPRGRLHPQPQSRRQLLRRLLDTGFDDDTDVGLEQAEQRSAAVIALSALSINKTRMWLDKLSATSQRRRENLDFVFIFANKTLTL